MRLDGTEFAADKTIAAFVEVYRRSAIPRVSVAFSEPRFASAVRLGDDVVVTTLPAGTRDDLGEEILR